MELFKFPQSIPKYIEYLFPGITQKYDHCTLPGVVFDVIKEHVVNMLRQNRPRTKFPHLVMIDEDVPLWAFIYYSFRSGKGMR